MNQFIFAFNLVVLLFTTALFGLVVMYSITSGGFWIFPILLGCAVIVHTAGILSIGVRYEH